MEGNGKSSALLHDPIVLGDLYRISDHSLMGRIAAKSPTIVETLVEAHAQLRRVFGADTQLKLSLERDPEIAGLEEIVVGIPVTNVEADARRLDQFDFHWWLHASEHEAANVCITLVP